MSTEGTLYGIFITSGLLSSENLLDLQQCLYPQALFQYELLPQQSPLRLKTKQQQQQHNDVNSKCLSTYWFLQRDKQKTLEHQTQFFDHSLAQQALYDKLILFCLPKKLLYNLKYTT